MIVDDHDLLRRGVKSLVLASGDGLEVCGEAVDGREAIQKALQLQPDVITMDVTMPNLNGFEATREIHRLLPESQIIMLSQHNSPAQPQRPTPESLYLLDLYARKAANFVPRCQAENTMHHAAG